MKKEEFSLREFRAKTTVKLQKKNQVFWDVTLSQLVNDPPNKSFETSVLFTGLLGVTSQKTWLFISTAIRTQKILQRHINRNDAFKTGTLLN
jgi:hypothetical protein